MVWCSDVKMQLEQAHPRGKELDLNHPASSVLSWPLRDSKSPLNYCFKREKKLGKAHLIEWCYKHTGLWVHNLGPGSSLLVRCSVGVLIKYGNSSPYLLSLSEGSMSTLWLEQFLSWDVSFLPCNENVLSVWTLRVSKPLSSLMTSCQTQAAFSTSSSGLCILLS